MGYLFGFFNLFEMKTKMIRIKGVIKKGRK